GGWWLGGMQAGSVPWTAPMPPNPFAVNVHALRRHPGDRTSEQRHGRLPGLQVTGSHVPDDAEVSIDAVLEGVNGGVVVTATVDTTWVGECRRCLEAAHGVVHGEMRELYEQDSDGEETYPLAGDQLDLAPLARDAVLLELPLAPLCTEDCQGLCPECGANRNEGDCGHASVPTDPRWAALDALRTHES
ncbi:MAG: hypothetical protein QOG64_3076, partial [Acidimicrobiaceae bacterium]|nr:hypothetical protein [Acidimicrobiaceae bacterium]